MRHWLLRACAAGVAAATLAACGGGDSGSGDGKGDAAKLEGRGPITLATGKDTSGVLNKVLEMWNKDHPNEKVRLIELPEAADEQRQRMIQNAQLKSGEFTVL